MSRTNFSTYMAIKSKLIQSFKTETFEKNKLPSEPVLAKRLGISLVTLRESLLMLALEGYITKRHGSGNYVHKSALDYENRSFYFYENFRRQGLTPGFKLLSQEYIPADEKISYMLSLPKDANILYNKIIYTADGKPAVYSRGHIPAELLVREDVENMSFEFVHELAWSFCRREVAHALNEYRPMCANEEISGYLKVAPGTPIIYGEQVFHDIHDEPLLFSYQYFHPDYYSIRTLQNWDLNQPV